MSDKKPASALQAQLSSQELLDSLKHLLQSEIRAEFSRQQKELDAASALSDDTDSKFALLAAINELKQEITELKAQQENLLASAIWRFIPPGPFTERFANDQAADKAEIARYVATHYFANQSSAFRYFVQASSTALHLAWALVHMAFSPNGSLIYTNSIVMPLPLLWRQTTGRPNIWTFCGWKFDPNCAGWTIPEGDTQSLNALRQLFQDDPPVTCAFISPIFVTPQDGLYYEEQENATIANCLNAAEEIVVLVPGSRIAESSHSFPKDRQYYPALKERWQKQAPQFHLIVSQHDRPKPQIVNAFRERGIRVSWLSTAGWDNGAS